MQDAESVRLQQQAHQQQHSCTLDECFQLYTKEEQVGGTPKAPRKHHGAGGRLLELPGSFRGAHSARCPQLAPDDAWRCPHCQVPQQGTVKLSLWTLPDILIIHLKRFRQVAEHRHKLTTLVRFPLRGLDMAPHLAPGGGRWAPRRLPESRPRASLYDLYAVCNHHGSMQGGHYTGECGAGRGTATGCAAGQRVGLGGTPGGGQWDRAWGLGALQGMCSGAWGTLQGLCFGVQPGFGVRSKEMGHGVGTCWRGMCSGAGRGVWRALQGCATRLGWHLRGMCDGVCMARGWGALQGICCGAGHGVGGMHNGQGTWAGVVGLRPRAAPAGAGLPTLSAPPRSTMGLPSPLYWARGGPGGVPAPSCPPSPLPQHTAATPWTGGGTATTTARWRRCRRTR